MQELRDIAWQLDPLALLRAVALAWPFALAVALDWPVVRHWGRRTSRPIRRAKPRSGRKRRHATGGPRAGRQRVGTLAASAAMNLVGAGASAVAQWLVGQLLTWLPTQISQSWFVRVIAERRLRAWEALALVLIVSGCVLAAKCVTWRTLAGAWPPRTACLVLSVAWACWLAAVWGVQTLMH
jgi:hypothetical protein